MRRVPARYAPVGVAVVAESVIGRRLAAAVPRGGYLGPGQLTTEPTSPVRPSARASVRPRWSGSARRT